MRWLRCERGCQLSSMCSDEGSFFGAYIEAFQYKGRHMNPIILQATHSDLPNVRMLLERHGLPTDGLRDRVGTTLVAR